MVCGPTAAGKSAIALALAERVRGSLVSADSRQVYRGFDIGTAKPTPDERQRVPHYGIDVADPAERYSAARWVEGVDGWLADIRASGRHALVVGGTGFYLRALVTPLFEQPPLEAARRAALESLLATMPTPELRRWCAALDPARAHLGRTQLLRAVEMALLTGERISAWHTRQAAPPARAARYLLVDPGAALRERIVHRVDAMLAAGWIDEVRRLRATIPPDAPAWNASGYRVIREVVEGTLSLGEARERIVIETRQYAKRQRTWFRHQLGSADVLQLDPAAPDAIERATLWWSSEEAA